VRLDLRYLGHSGVRELSSGSALIFEPNLARSKVFFDGELREPVRFREAVSALHAVVVGDLKFKKRDKTAYVAWQQQQLAKQADLKQALFDHAKQEELARIATEPIPAGLELDFQRLHRVYWTARRKWASELSQHDPELFRHLVPCDPVVTVAPDVVFFECFAKDESSYGSLSVNREAFRPSAVASGNTGLGTTNVDYSLALFDHFQTLRTYRPTRLLVDPAGFEVEVDASQGYREEKIDLPPSWLRGFGQLQAAMALPARRIELSIDVVYSILAYLKRHREKTGPRSLRFRLEPGKPPTVVLDPWGIAIASRGKPYDGERAEEIKVWGRRRLFPFARALPLAERFEVRLLGSGLPSIWTAYMGEMTLTLALSGWTANDWTSGSNLDQHFAGYQADATTAETLARYLETARVASTTELRRQVQADDKTVLGSLHALAKRGQVAFDFAADVYRWRPILPVALSEQVLGPEPPELANGRRLAADVTLERDEPLGGGKRLLVAKVAGTSCEGVVDSDGAFGRAKCSCSFFHRNRLRVGPCRHLIALRVHALKLAVREVSLARAPADVRSVGTVEATRSGQVYQLAESTLQGIGEEAERRRVSAHAVVEQAWRIARTRIREAANVAVLEGGGARPPAGSKTARAFELAAPIKEEIQSEAARLDVSVSRVLEIAWTLAQGTMRLTSSVLDSSR
jgi:hypothetical protein